MARRVAVALLAGLISSALVFGCGFERSSGGDDGLAVGVSFGPDNGWAIDTDDAFVLTKLGVAEPLVKVGFDGESEPGLAESWERVDARTWRFELRDGVTFHDGGRLDADAAVGALRYVLGSSAPPRALEEGSAEVRAVGELAVEVGTEEPDPILPQRLSSPNTAILAPGAYKGEGPPDPFGAGTGPFELTEETPDERAILRAHEGYWGGRPRVREVVARFVADPSVRANMLRTGELDIAEEVPIPQLRTLSEADGVEVVSEAASRTTSLYTNTESGPLSDRRVREALRLAVDREALVENVLGGSGIPAGGVFSPEEPWASDDLPSPEHDPQRARELLKEAGHGGLRLDLWTYTERAELRDVTTAVQGMLSEAGVEADVRVSQYAALEPDVLAGNFDLFVLSRSYLTDVNDPSGFLSDDYTCDGSYNLNRYCSEDLDRLVGRLNGAEDARQRYELFQRAEETLIRDVAGVPLYHQELRTAHTTAVQNYRTHPLEHYLLTPDLGRVR